MRMKIRELLIKLFIIFAILTISNFANAQTKTLSLSLPLDCQPQKTCFIQNYVDIDPTKNALDYTNGQATYDGHKGTDIRLLSVSEAKKGVNVLASAAGTVKATRDGMVDRLIIDLNDASIQNRECGNGVVIDHGNGWETQYCHMRQGSVIVQKGDVVERSGIIGKVGYSGQAQFAHLHITVRYNGKIVDPFLGANLNDLDISNSLWNDAMLDAFTYQSGKLIQSGFATTPVNPADLELGKLLLVPVSSQAPAIVFYARFINLKKGDQISFEIIGPSGEIVTNISKPLERSKAHYVAYSGKKRPNGGWTQGEYIGNVTLLRKGNAILNEQQIIFIE